MFRLLKCDYNDERPGFNKYLYTHLFFLFNYLNSAANVFLITSPTSGKHHFIYKKKLKYKLVQ